ncbi:hypothetical protein RCO48_05060 [Peribacillus frigoritolerans]|nr:hypothetical protein [Peribacillus frigoritolerans]
MITVYFILIGSFTKDVKEKGHLLLADGNSQLVSVLDHHHLRGHITTFRWSGSPFWVYGHNGNSKQEIL